MSNSILSQIKRGTGDLPPRILCAGPEGIGKTTFASKAPEPVFIAAEDGLTGMDYLPRFTPGSLDDLNTMLDALIAGSNGYKTLVVDTTDWLERLICASVCKRDGKSDIEEYGYGKGYVIMEGELIKLLQKFDTLRHKQKIGIVLLSHVQIRTFNDPRGDSWDRYEMKGHKRFTGILREWPDACLFATFEVFKTKAKGDKREKTIGGERIIHTQWSPAWDAKNRLNLPEIIPLEWDDFQKAVNENSPATLRAEFLRLHKTAHLTDPDKPRWDKAVANIENLTADKLKAGIEKLKTLQTQTT